MLSVPPPLPALLQDMPALPRGRLGLRMPSRVQPAPAWPAAYTEAPHACARTHAGARRAHALVLPAAPHAPLTPAASSCKAVSQSASHSPIRNSKRGRAVGDCDKNASFRGRASPGRPRCDENGSRLFMAQEVSTRPAALAHSAEDQGHRRARSPGQRPAGGEDVGSQRPAREQAASPRSLGLQLRGLCPAPRLGVRRARAEPAGTAAGLLRVPCGAGCPRPPEFRCVPLLHITNSFKFPDWRWGPG